MFKDAALKEHVPTAVIHQPEYWPWVGFFHKVLYCDTLVILDHVQSRKRSNITRNLIRTEEGTMHLTIPVNAEFGQKINEVTTVEPRSWQQNHYDNIRRFYSKTTGFRKFNGVLERYYKEHVHADLLEADVSALLVAFKLLGLEPKIILSSTLDPVGRKEDMLIDILKKIGINRYLSGTGLLSYADVNKFKEAGIELRIQEFEHPTYRQQWEPFISGLSALDFIMNTGDRAGEIIRLLRPAFQDGR